MLAARSGALAGVSAADGAVVFDFGALVVFDAPFARVQERPLLGLPQPLHAPFRALELKLAEATKTLNVAKAAYTQVTAEKTSLSQQLAELGKTLETTKLALEQANVERAALGKSLGATKLALEQVSAERAQLAAKLVEREQALDQVTMERAALSKTLGVTQVSLEQATTERAELADKLAERDQELAQALAELKTLGEEGPAAGLGEVVEGIGGQLKSVRESLAGSSFALGRVSLDLKVVPSAGGVKIAFPTRGELKSLPRDVISSLNLDFAAVAPTRPVVKGEEKLKLPDLSGDTEVMARRRLAALDLGVKVGQRELAPDDVKSVGRVVKQVPEPGAPVTAGAVVTILLGKPSRKV